MSILNDESENAAPAIARTRHWLEQAVIGLNLCPFAKLPYQDGRVRIVVSDAADEDSLLQDLADELAALRGADPQECETSVLVHPHVLGDFLAYNDFLDAVDALLEALGLDGELQVASFHPDYQFADTAPDDITNCSNRAPHPTLHLLREASVERAVDSVGDTDAIFERNMGRLRELSWAGWRALLGE